MLSTPKGGHTFDAIEVGRKKKHGGFCDVREERVAAAHKLFGCIPYDWDDGFLSTDGHAWCLGIDMLNCPKKDTGNTVSLQINVPFEMDPVSVDCNIYSVSASLFTENPSVESITIAVGRHNHYHVLFTDMNAMIPLLEHMNKEKEVLEEAFNDNHPETVKYSGPSNVREERVNAANSLFGCIPYGKLQENGIPLSMNLNALPENKGIKAMKAASVIAEKNGLSDMTLDEINMEIGEVRK